MTDPRISVVIPARDAGQYLCESLDSVLAQSVPPLEIIAVDDGSQDDTQAILAAYAPRVRCLKLDGRGAAGGPNAAPEICQGDLVAFLDADDAWLPERLELGLAALQRAPEAPLQYSDALVIQDGLIAPGTYLRGRRPLRSDLSCLLLDNFIGTSTVMTRRVALLQSGGFDESLWIAHDYDLWLRVLERADGTLVDRPMVRYRNHSGGIGQDAIRAQLETIAVVERWGSQAPSRRLSTLHYFLGRQLLDAGRFEEARSAFLSSLGHGPWELRVLAFVAACQLGDRAAAALARAAGRLRDLLARRLR